MAFIAGSGVTDHPPSITTGDHHAPDHAHGHCRAAYHNRRARRQPIVEQQLEQLVEQRHHPRTRDESYCDDYGCDRVVERRVYRDAPRRSYRGEARRYWRELRREREERRRYRDHWDD